MLTWSSLLTNLTLCSNQYIPDLLVGLMGWPLSEFVLLICKLLSFSKAEVCVVVIYMYMYMCVYFCGQVMFLWFHDLCGKLFNSINSNNHGFYLSNKPDFY